MLITEKQKPMKDDNENNEYVLGAILGFVLYLWAWYLVFGELPFN